MRKLSLITGFSLLMFFGVAHSAEARGRFVVSLGFGAPVYVPYGYYPADPYYPPYPVAPAPYYYAPYYYPVPAVTYYGGSYYSPRVYSRYYPRYGYGYGRGYMQPGRAYGHYTPRQYRRR